MFKPWQVTDISFLSQSWYIFQVDLIKKSVKIEGVLYDKNTNMVFSWKSSKMWRIVKKVKKYFLHSNLTTSVALLYVVQGSLQS